MRRSALTALPVLALAVGAAALAPPSSAASPAGHSAARTAGLAARLTAGQTAARGSTPSFGVPRIVDPIHVYGEPDIAVNPKTGAVHASGPQGTGTQRSIYNISVDSGDSYRIVQNLPENTDRAYGSGAVPTKSALGPGGGDTEIQIAHNGRAFFNDLGALLTFTAVTTTDDGKTTSIANPLAIPKPLGDRQWMALFDPQPSDHTVSPYTGKVPLNYMEYDNLTSGDTVALSDDGVDYSRTAGTYANDATHSVNNGVPVLDQHTGKFLGLTSNSVQTDPNAKCTGKDLAVAVGVPDAAGTLSFHYNPLAVGRPGCVETLFPVLAQDGARNLYAVWIQDNDYSVYYSWAPPGKDNEWKAWSTPRKINRPPANVNVFPWIAAGKAPGIIDVAWYGTNKTLAQLGADGPSAKKDQTWQLFFSQVSAATSKTPKVAQVIAAPHPMHYNDICLLGSACITGAGNRNQADFFKVVVDPLTGRARIIYTDSSNRLSQAIGTDTAADHQGAALDTVVTQNTGLSALTGKPLRPQESTAPVSSITDPTGDSLFKPLGGSYVPGADITKVSLARKGKDLQVTITTKGTLGAAARAARTPDAQAVVRWQMGNTLFFVAADATSVGATSYYGGRTSSVDLCSVSGCKPNYLTYDAPPAAGVVGATGRESHGTYTITIPLSAVGSPSSSSLLEEVMGFVTVSPQAGVVPQNNGMDFADIAPLQLEGTKTFNAKLSAPAGNGSADPQATPGPTTDRSRANGGTGTTASRSGSTGSLATTGLSTGLPLVAVGLLGLAGLAARRRRAG